MGAAPSHGQTLTLLARTNGTPLEPTVRTRLPFQESTQRSLFPRIAMQRFPPLLQQITPICNSCASRQLLEPQLGGYQRLLRITAFRVLPAHELPTHPLLGHGCVYWRAVGHLRRLPAQKQKLRFSIKKPRLYAASVDVQQQHDNHGSRYSGMQGSHNGAGKCHVSPSLCEYCAHKHSQRYAHIHCMHHKKKNFLLLPRSGFRTHSYVAPLSVKGPFCRLSSFKVNLGPSSCKWE